MTLRGIGEWHAKTMEHIDDENTKVVLDEKITSIVFLDNGCAVFNVR